LQEAVSGVLTNARAEWPRQRCACTRDPTTRFAIRMLVADVIGPSNAKWHAKIYIGVCQAQEADHERRLKIFTKERRLITN